MDKLKIEDMPLGEVVDLYRAKRDLRLAMQKEVDTVGAVEKELKEFLIDNIPKSGNTGVAGKKFRAQIKEKTVPKADDWDKIRAFVVENDRFDLLQRRLNNKAVEETFEAGEEVPGVGWFKSLDVSVTKI